MGALMRSHDWTTSPVGEPQTWPQSLRTMVAACLNSPMLGAVLWGADLVMLYNDAYIPSMANRHPQALGRPVAEVWGDAWKQVAAPFLETLKTGKGFEQQRVKIDMVRNGRHETTWWNITATPIRGEDGSIVGLLNQGVEITANVQSEDERLQAQEQSRTLNQTLESRVAQRTASLRLHEHILRSHSSRDGGLGMFHFHHPCSAHSPDACQPGDRFPSTPHQTQNIGRLSPRRQTPSHHPGLPPGAQARSRIALKLPWLKLLGYCKRGYG